MKFKVLGLDELEKDFKNDFKSGSVEFGYGEKSGSHPKSGMKYSDIAYISEWGASIKVYGNDGTIPKRPFFSETIDKFNINGAEIEHGMLSKGVLKTKWIIDTLCSNIKADIKESIKYWKEPKNARLTVRKKGFDDPLVETGGLGEACVKQGDIKFENL